MAGPRILSNIFNWFQGWRLSIRDFAMPESTIDGEFVNAGWLLSQMDKAGGRRAYKYIGGRCVTVGIEAMAFRKPVFLGDQVSIYTKVLKEGKTSLKLKIEAWAERKDSNIEEKVTEGVFTFVAIDHNRNPKPIRQKCYDAPSTLPRKEKPAERQPLQQPSYEAEPTIKNTNYNGDIFGGWTLEQMDKACAQAARVFSGETAATVGIEAMEFIRPVLVGDKVLFYTSIAKKGRTSVSVKVESWAERAHGDHVKVTEGLFTYVAVDKERKPVVISAEP